MNSARIKAVQACDTIAFISLCVIAFFLPISKAVIESFSILAIIVCLIRKFVASDFSPPLASPTKGREIKLLPQTPLNYGILAYLVVCVVSIFFSSNYLMSVKTFFLKTLQSILFYFAIAETLTSGKRIKIILYVLFASSFVLGIDGIYQYFTRVDFLRHRPRIFEDRIYASFVTPNSFGCYLAMVLPFALSYFFMKIRLKISKIAYLILFLLLFACLLLTMSRGGWFAFLSSMLFMGLWIPSLAVFFLILGLLVVATEPFHPPVLKERLKNFFIFTDNSSVDRKIIWQAGWKMFLSNPWFGVGLGAFMFNFRKFVVDGYPYGVPYAHNCYLQMASEVGVIGLFSFLSILVLFFYHGIKILNSYNRSYSWYILLASQAAILGYCVQMGVDTILYSLDLGMLFWLVLGIGVAAMKNLPPHPTLSPEGERIKMIGQC